MDVHFVEIYRNILIDVNFKILQHHIPLTMLHNTHDRLFTNEASAVSISHLLLLWYMNKWCSCMRNINRWHYFSKNKWNKVNMANEDFFQAVPSTSMRDQSMKLAKSMAQSRVWSNLWSVWVINNWNSASIWTEGSAFNSHPCPRVTSISGQQGK